LRPDGTDLTRISPLGLGFVDDPDWGASSATGSVADRALVSDDELVAMAGAPQACF
jgi:hypothetical protein